MTLTADLATRTAPLLRQIHDMPFNRELAAGTLPAAVFQGYIIQDAHYLEGFARALALAAAKAPDPDSVAQLAGSAAGAIAVERQLHAHYLELFGVGSDRFKATKASQACDHYVAFLLRATALGDFPEALAALLPCFWIYRDVGRSIAERAASGNPYTAWIDTYSGGAFNESVERMLALTDRVGENVEKAAWIRIHHAFRQSCWHEWHFWDSAYHQRAWPEPPS